MFDDDNLVSNAGLVPLMQLADKVQIASSRVKSGAVNPASKRIQTAQAARPCAKPGLNVAATSFWGWSWAQTVFVCM